MVTDIPFLWYSIPENILLSSQRKDEGSWLRKGFLPGMNFSIILNNNQLSILELPIDISIDFERYVGIWAYLGEANTGGYRIYIRRIEKDIDKTIKVTVALISPKPGILTLQVIEYPNDFCLVERKYLGEGNLTFKFLDQNNNLLQKKVVSFK